MNTCFVEYLQGPSTGCTCLGCVGRPSSENFITHFEETKEYSVTRTWCFWILVEAKFFIYKNLPEIFSALQNIFSEISFAKYVFSVKDLREVSAEGEIAQTTCLVRVWISFLWECGFHYIKTARVKLLNGEHLNREMWKKTFFEYDLKWKSLINSISTICKTQNLSVLFSNSI